MIATTVQFTLVLRLAVIAIVIVGCGRRNFNIDGADGVGDDASLRGPVLHLRFDEGVTTDSSGNGHQAMCGSCPRLGTGHVGIASGNFDGDECLLIPDAPDLRPQELTVMAWAVAGQQDSSIVSRAYMGATSFLNTFDLFITAQPQVGFAVGGREIRVSRTTSWHHFAGVYANSVATFYLDGNLVGEMPAPALTYDTNDLFRIGCDFDSNVELFHFSGHIDDVRIYDRPLSQDEIQQITREL